PAPATTTPTSRRREQTRRWRRMAPDALPLERDRKWSYGWPAAAIPINASLRFDVEPEAESDEHLALPPDHPCQSADEQVGRTIARCSRMRAPFRDALLLLLVPLLPQRRNRRDQSVA